MIGGHKVYLCCGDIFSENVVQLPLPSQRIVVVPVNRCFDMYLGDGLIAETSIHGQGIKKVWEWTGDKAKKLNCTVHRKLKELGYKGTQLKTDEKVNGSMIRYAAGTVVPYQVTGNCMFYFLAHAMIGADNRASSTPDELHATLRGLLRFIDANANGTPVIIPLMGTGFSRIGKSEDQMLHTLVDTLYLYGDKLKSDIYIVLSAKQREKIKISRYL